MGLQDLPNGLKGDGRHDAIGLQLTSQFGAIPLREGTSKLIRSFTGQLDYMEGYLGRKQRRATRARPLTQACTALLTKSSRPFSQVAFAQADLSGCGSKAQPSFKQQEGTGASD